MKITKEELLEAIGKLYLGQWTGAGKVSKKSSAQSRAMKRYWRKRKAAKK